MDKKNCWEFKNCGREPGGAKVSELGSCPAAIDVRVNGVNSGKNGGRACWVIAGTFCGGKVQGTYALKVVNCLKCEFFQLVRKEEEDKYVTSSAILAKLKDDEPKDLK
ncbi:MAG: hypothetical protein HQL25_00990 [Candidatus Omnitrophica bacterium]|nr:hypothetical protein [Candidatus Omnitrophota bacterium]